MPKPTKLHSKGKATSIQKPCKVEKDSGDGIDPEDSLSQFQLELCWCIQQLERTLNEKKGTEKQLQETWKVLTVLKNNNQPMIRKRQLMRTHLGDYRAKMAAEEKKLAKMASRMKISEVPDKPKATFLRKSAFLTTGDDSFRFNFHITPEQAKASSSTSPENTIPTSQNNGNTKKEVVTIDEKTSKENAKSFKFSNSNTDFKFNFIIDK